MNTKFDVIIAGSGPAGCKAASILAKNGMKILLLEKEKIPRYKTCGGGVVWRARQFMPVDIAPVVEREFFTVDFYTGVSENHHFTVTRSKPVISMTMRDKLDTLLVEHVKSCGAEVIDATPVAGIEVKSTDKVVIQTPGTSFTCKYVIAADGAFSPVAAMLKIPDGRYCIPALEYEITLNDRQFERYCHSARFDLDAAPAGYGWVFPKKSHLSAGVLTTRRGKCNLPHYLHQYLLRLGIDNPVNMEKHGYQIPVSPRKALGWQNILLTGDAAGLADPVVAEGISNALISGALAANAILIAEKDKKPVLDIYTGKIQENLLPQLQIAGKLARLFYDNPALRNRLFKWRGRFMAEVFTEVFMGNLNYPVKKSDYVKYLLNPGLLLSRKDLFV